MLRNMSAGGAMAHVASPFEIGECVTLDLRLGEQISARVAWVRDNVAGLTFTQLVDLAKILAVPASVGPRPRAPRLRVAAPGRLQVERDAYRVVTTDVSQSGAKLFVGVPIAWGFAARLSIDGLPSRSGVIRWSANGMAGVSFDQQLGIWELTKWAKAQRSQPDPFVQIAGPHAGVVAAQ